MSEEFTHTLKTPVELGGQTYETVTLREPDVRDYEIASEGTTNSVTVIIKVISRLSGIPQAAVRKMKQSDFIVLSEYIGNFLGASPETGET